MLTDPTDVAMPPRIPPGSRREIGLVNDVIAATLGAATGVQRPNLFTTLSRHRSLYRRWLRFAAALMPGGALPRIDSELVILRVAHRCDCEYEWRHHEHLAVQAGLTPAEVDRTQAGPGADGWSDRRRSILVAVDELLTSTTLSDTTWERLRRHIDERQLIELPMLVGHYAMLAMTLNALRVQPDPPPTEPRGLVGRVAMAVARRRG